MFQRIPLLLKLADGAAREQINLQTSEDSHLVARLNASGSGRVSSLQQTVQIIKSLALTDSFEAVSNLLGTTGTLKNTFKKCPKIKTGSPDNERDFSTLADLLTNLSGLHHIAAGAEVLVGIKQIIEMVGNFSSLFKGGLGRTDFKQTIHLLGVAVDDLAIQSLGGRKSQPAFPGRGRAKDGNEEFSLIWHLLHCWPYQRRARVIPV
jgi:hypothetical protein